MPKKNGDENDYAKEIDFQISYSVDSDDKVTIYVSRDDSFTPSSTFYAYVVPIGFSPSDIPRFKAIVSLLLKSLIGMRILMALEERRRQLLRPGYWRTETIFHIRVDL